MNFMASDPRAEKQLQQDGGSGITREAANHPSATVNGTSSCFPSLDHLPTQTAGLDQLPMPCVTPTPLDEIPRPPQRRSLGYWLALLLVVLPVYLVIPLSWTFVAVWVFSYLRSSADCWTQHLASRITLFYAIIEVVFSVWHFRLYLSIAHPSSRLLVDSHLLSQSLRRVLQAGLVQRSNSNEQPTSTSTDEFSIFEQLDFNDPRAVEFRDSLRTWFRGVPWSEIRRGEMYAWLYWATHGLPFPGLKELDDVPRATLQDAMRLLEYRVGGDIPEGSNPAATPMLLRLDPIGVWMRPFMLYFFIAVGNFILAQSLRRIYKVQHGRLGNIEYILRVPENWTPSEQSPTPIVLLHGLGVGFLQYASTITGIMSKCPDRPLLVVRQPSISQDLFHPRHLKPLTKDEMVHGMGQLFDSLGWSVHGVTMVSHSNGSLPHAWLVKELPSVVRRSCFIDPIVFCLWDGEVCNNFVYRPPYDAITCLMRYFVGNELGIGYTVQRCFNWAENSLFVEDIPDARNPRSARFYLGGKDTIVPSDNFRRYLIAHGVHDGNAIQWNPTGRHGEAILTSRHLDGICSWLSDDSHIIKY